MHANPTALILIPGWGASESSFVQMQKSLGEHFSLALVAPALNLDGPDWQAYAHRLDTWLVENLPQSQRYLLVAFSLGCNPALRFVTHTKHKPHALVMMMPHLSDFRAPTWYLAGQNLSVWAGALYRHPDLIKPVFGDVLKRSMQQPRKHVELVTHTYRQALTDLLEQVDVPCLVIAGEDDPLSPPNYSKDIAERLPKGRFETVDGTHSWAFEHPEDFAQLMSQEV